MSEPTYEELAEENRDLRKKVDELFDRVEALEEENQRLREENERLREENKKLRRENKKLRKENKELKERLEGEKRKKRRQAAPFRKESENEEKEKKEPGRKKGHDGQYREEPDKEPDRIERARLPGECEHCGADLEGASTVEEVEIHSQYQDHLELIHELIQFNVETGKCSSCGERLVGEHPERDTKALGAAGNNLSDGAKALASQLKYKYGVTVRKIARIFNEHTGIQVSPGGLIHAASRLEEGLEATQEKIEGELRDSEKVHSDETGWRIDGDNAWLWVLCNNMWTTYEIVRSRGHEVVEGILGEEYEGILHSDCYPAYDSLDYEQQKCVAHLLRRASELEEEKIRRAVCFGRDVKKLFQDALELLQRQDEIGEEKYKQQREEIEERMNGILERDITEEDNARFQKCLKKQREHLFRFLYREEADPTNNRAERDLRGAVIARKLSGCNRSDKGGRMYGVIKSVCETARKQGENVMELLKRAFQHQRRGDPVAVL